MEIKRARPFRNLHAVIENLLAAVPASHKGPESAKYDNDMDRRDGVYPWFIELERLAASVALCPPEINLDYAWSQARQIIDSSPIVDSPLDDWRSTVISIWMGASND